MTGTSVCCCWCCSYSCCCCLLLLLLLQWQQKPRRDSRTAAHELEDGSRWRDKVGRTKPGSPKVVEGKRNRTGVLCCTLYQPTQKYHFKVCHWVLSSVLVFDMKLHYISHGNKLGVAMSWLCTFEHCLIFMPTVVRFLEWSVQISWPCHRQQKQQQCRSCNNNSLLPGILKLLFIDPLSNYVQRSLYGNNLSDWANDPSWFPRRRKQKIERRNTKTRTPATFPKQNVCPKCMVK